MVAGAPQRSAEDNTRISMTDQQPEFQFENANF